MKRLIALPQLSTTVLRIGFNKTSKDIYLDGTQSNFKTAMSTLATHYSMSVKNRSEPYDSDSDFSASQNDYSEKNEAYIWSPDTISPAARRTTITCANGNVKGNQLITWARKYIAEFLDAHRGECNGEDLELCATTYPGRYFAISAGKFAKIKTSMDSNQRFAPGEYVLGLSQVELRLTEEPSGERLFIEDEDLKNWLLKDLQLPITRWDLPYRGYTKSSGEVVVGIREILDRIKQVVVCHASGKARHVPDNELGTIQLYCAFPESSPLGDGPYLDILRQGQLHKFLDFFNALIFGVEASRNNLVFLTGLIALENMRYGSHPAENNIQSGPFSYNNLLDIFPMAVTGTGAGNFVAEKALVIATKAAEDNKMNLMGRPPVGFTFFRDNSGWLKVTVKSAILIHTWLADHGILESASELPIDRPAASEFESPQVPTGNKLLDLIEQQHQSDQRTNNFRYHFNEEIDEILLHHYERGDLDW